MSEPLPEIEFGFPGPGRDVLLEAIRSGRKTTTSSLLREYEVGDEALPEAGTRGTVIDSDGVPRFTIETRNVQIVALDDVPLAHALAEGEGFDSVAQWRDAHLAFWTSSRMRAELGADTVIDGSTLVVLETFVVVP